MRSRASLRRRGNVPRRGRVLVGVALAGLAALVPAAPASALGTQDPAPVSFDAVASAYGFQSLVSNPTIPLGLTIEGSGPVAQSLVSSLGASNGFASFPYPGDVVAGLPGSLGSLILPGLSTPNYPFYISSSYGTPASPAVNYPGLSLQSESTKARSRSSALVGQAAVGFEARSDVGAEDGTVTAIANNNLNVLQVGDGLTLSGVRSEAKAVLTPDGKLTKTSSLSVGRLSVPGLAIAIPPALPANGPIPAIPLPFGGTTLERPDVGIVDNQFVVRLPLLGSQGFAIPAQPVLDAFAAAGYYLTFQKAQETPTSIVAPTLTIKTVLPAPPENQFVSGKTPLSITVGLAQASIVGGAVAGSNGAPSLPNGPGAAPGGSSGQPGAPVGTGTPAPPVLNPGAVGGGTAPSEVASLADPSSDGANGLVSAASVFNPRSSIFWFYLVLVGVALTGTMTSQALRYLGVRSA